jgi:hypothetical protein
MFRIETPPLARHEAERFKTAFYRFLETNPPPMEEAAWLEVRAVDGGERHAALLWSQDAADAFEAYTARVPARAPWPTRIRRFDDLGL